MSCTKLVKMKMYFDNLEETINIMETRLLDIKITDNITINFLMFMNIFFRISIYMCENLIKFSTYEPLELFCEKTISKKIKDIEKMREIVMTTKGNLSSKRDVRLYKKSCFCINKNIIYNLKGLLSINNINMNFINEMIVYNEYIIKVCENTLKYQIDFELKKFIEKILEESIIEKNELKIMNKNIEKDKVT